MTAGARGRSPGAPAGYAGEVAFEHPPGIDSTKLKRRFSSHVELMHEFARMFLEKGGEIMADIEAAAAAADPHALEHAAHKLKSTLGMLAADRAAATACRLEYMGRRGNLTEIDRLLSELQSQVDQVRRELGAISDLG
jgi:HPt (histidine-containing phosphotransfer) domain-containing protein